MEFYNASATTNFTFSYFWEGGLWILLIGLVFVSCALVSKCLEKIDTQYMSHLIQWEVEKACTAHLHHFSTFYGLAPPLLHNTYTLLYIYIILLIVIMGSYLVSKAYFVSRTLGPCCVPSEELRG